MNVSETTDNLLGSASEETTGQNGQAGSEESSTSQSQTASTETTDKLILGKFRGTDDLVKAYKELEKRLGQKSGESIIKQITQEAPKETAAVTGQTTAENRQAAQAAGGDALEQWYSQAVQVLGKTKADMMLIKHLTEQNLSQVLAPVNEQRNTDLMESAAERLALQYDDFMDYVADGTIKKVLASDKEIRELFEKASTREAKMKYLKMAYLEAREVKESNSTAASKAAGAKDAKQRDDMKGASVAGTSRGQSTGEKSSGESWFESMKEHDKGRNLFGE